MPFARSSITRSSIEMAKVTPAAFRVWRSRGASSHGFFGSRPSGAVLATIASRSPMRSPLTAASALAGLSSSQSALTVGNLAVTSKTPSPRTATTAGPFACGSQTRPTSVPFVPSSGRRSLTVNVVMAASSLFLGSATFASSRSHWRRPINVWQGKSRPAAKSYAPARAFMRLPALCAPRSAGAPSARSCARPGRHRRR